MKTLPTTGHRLVFTGKNEVELQPFALSAPAAGEVLVENQCSLLSTGTETIVFARKFDPGTHWDAWVRYPFRPGYATVGRVLAVGEGVEGIAPGKRVATRMGHGSHVVMKAENAYPIPDDVTAEDAIWFGLAKIAGHGVRAAQISLGQSVVVIGAGPIGQMATRWALVSGAARVLVADLSLDRLKLAARAGAIPVQGSAAETTAEVRRILGGARPDVVIDSTGNAEVLKSAFGMVETEGTVVLLGDTGTPTEQRLTGDVISRGLKLVGAHDGRNSPQWNNPVAADRFFEFVRTKRFPLDGLITHRFLPSQCVEAYTLASTDRLRTLGVLFDWSQAAKTLPAETAAPAAKVAALAGVTG
ncbi:MAG: threonine dehydrogenase [Rariglobus sp.]|jgi:2-desacetyl-2-hydroxyethyl bacteriochlorophyllide A dehydrogenase|nr:threonine dehydrogenase [Rariglobus sp.]